MGGPFFVNCRAFFHSLIYVYSMMFSRILLISVGLVFAQEAKPSLDLDFPLKSAKSTPIDFQTALKLARYAKLPTLVSHAAACKENQKGFPFVIRSVKYPSIHSSGIKSFQILEVGYCGDFNRSQTMLFAVGPKGPKAALFDVCADQMRFYQDLNMDTDLLVGTCASIDRNFFNQRAESYRFFDGRLQPFASLGLVHSDNCNSKDKNRTEENVQVKLKNNGQIEVKKERKKCS